MRRVASIILFILGAWMLSTEVMMAWASAGAGMEGGGKVLTSLLFVGLAAPFLLTGSWVSPGNRRAELGLTIMIAAAIGFGIGAISVLMMNDPAFLRAMPAHQPMPEIGIDTVYGTLNLLLVAGIGYFLRWSGKRREPDPATELQQVFD